MTPADLTALCQRVRELRDKLPFLVINESDRKLTVAQLADAAPILASECQALLRYAVTLAAREGQTVCGECGHAMHQPNECRVCNGCKAPREVLVAAREGQTCEGCAHCDRFVEAGFKRGHCRNPQTPVDSIANTENFGCTKWQAKEPR